jgi:ATP-dependent DNA helicase RecG
MTVEGLVELVRTVQSYKAEMQHVEVKAAHQGSPKRLFDTLSGFANQRGGGILLFGLEEETGFRVVGVYDPQDLQTKVNEQCKQMSPVLRPLFTMATVDGAVVVSAEIPEVEIVDRPCFYQGAGRLRGAYVRVGSSDEPMTEYEVYAYESYRLKRQDEVRPVERAKVSDLDTDALEEYLIRLRSGKPNLSRMGREALLELMRITIEGVPTLAAVLLFSPYPQAFFPQFTITAVVVPGTEIGEVDGDGARFVDNRRLDGPLPQMLEEADSFVLRNMTVRTLIDGNGRRTDVPEYPHKAVREAILNALVHRDYGVHAEGTPVRILFFHDRLEIRSPGGLYGKMTLEQLGRAHADSRNPLLANMLETLKLVENRYSGIPTLRREMKEAGLPAPVFLEERGSFCVILYNRNSLQSKPGTEELLDFCRTPRSREEIADHLGLKSAYYAVRTVLRPLVDMGRLRMTHPDKPGSHNQRFVSS